MSYSSYANALCTSKKAIYCPNCFETMIAKEYLKHRKLVHDPDFNARIQCGFCSLVRWKYGEKAKQSRHLNKCLNSFLRNYDAEKLKAPVIDLDRLKENHVVPCDCDSFIPDPLPIPVEEQHPNVGRFYEPVDLGDVPDWLRIRESKEEMHRVLLSSGATHLRAGPFELSNVTAEDDCRSFHDAEEDPLPEVSVKSLNQLSPTRLLVLMNSLEFDEKFGLGEAAFWIRTYTRFADSYLFLHAMVRMGTFRSFEDLLNSDKVYLLPYWCLCDGHSSDSQDPLYVWHRHMLMVVRDIPWFNRVKTRLVFDGILPGKQKRATFKRIKSTLHFINVMYYTSSCKSQSGRSGRRYHGLHHKTLNIPAVLHAKINFCLMVPSMIETFVRILIKDKKVGDIETKYYINRQWYANAAEMTGIQNCRIRFRDPSMTVDLESRGVDLKQLADGLLTKPCVFWMQDCYFFVKTGGPPSTLFNLSENPLIDSLVLAKSQQKTCNDIWSNVKTLKLQIRDHEDREAKHLERIHRLESRDRLMEELTEKCGRLEEENRRLREEISLSTEKYGRLEEESEQWKKEASFLSGENRRLKDENGSLREELLKEEIGRLREEIGRLREENGRLRHMLEHSRPCVT